MSCGELSDQRKRSRERRRRPWRLEELEDAGLGGEGEGEEVYWVCEVLLFGGTFV